ncbi:MAG: hypothetical protein U9Q33_02910 [Campylobacterota bacterium]|nr:hypothetical protein [Campylobacterota bacterium]
MKKILYTLLFASLFIGCSSKKYFEPKYTEGEYNSEESFNDSFIKSYNNEGITLDNKFISKKELLTLDLKEGYSFINENDQIILAVNNEAKLLIIDNKVQEELQFDKNIISASIKGKLLALGFVDNSIIIYDRETKQVLFKEYFASSIINDMRIANPIFMKSILLFPTLDGKVIILDTDKKTILRTINVDPKNKINNIIFLSTLNDTLITATPNKIFTFNNGIINVQEHDIKNILINKEDIFLSTIDGKIIKYDHNLKLIESKKFKYANFHALGYGSSLYALESQGYLIKLNNDLSETKIFQFPFDNSKKTVILKDKIYYENKFSTLE